MTTHAEEIISTNIEVQIMQGGEQIPFAAVWTSVATSSGEIFIPQNTYIPGASSYYVRLLQTSLNFIGGKYYCGSADGVYGTNTRNAVKLIQGDSGISVDGIVGGNTWAAVANRARELGKVPF